MPITVQWEYSYITKMAVGSLHPNPLNLASYLPVSLPKCDKAGERFCVHHRPSLQVTLNSWRQDLTHPPVCRLLQLSLLWPCHRRPQIFFLLAPRGCNDFRTEQSPLISETISWRSETPHDIPSSLHYVSHHLSALNVSSHLSFKAWYMW